MGQIFFYNFKGIKKGITVGIASNGKAITGVFFARHFRALSQVQLPQKIGIIDDFSEVETPLIKKAAAQIEEYLAGTRKQFSLPLAMHGTEFQMAVWQALQRIPYGETRSYKEIAVMIGKPQAARAVGMANNRNPISIIVPCHRVIGHDGSLVGYGSGIPLKKFFLELEHVPL